MTNKIFVAKENTPQSQYSKELLEAFSLYMVDTYDDITECNPTNFSQIFSQSDNLQEFSDVEIDMLSGFIDQAYYLDWNNEKYIVIMDW